MVQQALDDGGMALIRRQNQGGAAVLVGRINLGLLGQEQVHNLLVAPVGCKDQSSILGRVLSIEIDLLCQEEGDDLRAPVGCGRD